MEKLRWWEWLLLLVIVGVAAYLRLWRVVETPGWFTDEGTHLEIARHLSNGRLQYLSVNQSVLLFARLPLFEWVLAGAVRLFGLGMGTVRGVTAIFGISSVVLQYFVVWDVSKDRWLALLAALMLAIFPAAVVYSRFGFSYNLLAPLVLVAVWGLHRYVREDLSGKQPQVAKTMTGLGAAATAIGLALISDLWALSLLPVLVLVVLWRRWRDLWWSLLLTLLPLGVFTAVSLLTIPDAFLFDVQFTLSRVSSPLAAQVRQLVVNVVTLLSQNGWMALGVVGVFGLRPLRLSSVHAFRLQAIVWLFLLLPVLVIGRTAALTSLSFYYMIPVLPLVALGVAGLVRMGMGMGEFNTKGRRDGGTKEAWGKLGVGLLVGVLVGGSVWMLGGQVNGVVETAVDPFLVDAGDAVGVAEFLNSRVQGDDLVIVSPTMSWMVNGRVADFQLAAVAVGYGTPHIPADLPAERQVFDADYRLARFVVVDKLWHNWAQFNVPGVAEILQDVAEWPLIFESGDVQVYENVEETVFQPD